MSDSDSVFSISNLEMMAAFDPVLAGFLERRLVKTYDDFITVLYKDIDAIVQLLQGDRHLLHDDSEDRLTVDIIHQLIHMGYNASHDAQHGGHCDILITKGLFRWIGEAKIHSSYPYLFQGFSQLSTRYTHGGSYNTEGALLIYLTQENARRVINKWMAHLTGKKLPSYQTSQCPKNALSFYSSHDHQVSGTAFKVRHIPVLLHFDPAA